MTIFNRRYVPLPIYLSFWSGYVMILPWLVRLDVEIIHELWIIFRTVGQPWCKKFIPSTSVWALHLTRFFALRLISVDK